MSTMALTHDETAVLKLVAAGALSAHEVSLRGRDKVLRVPPSGCGPKLAPLMCNGHHSWEM